MVALFHDRVSKNKKGRPERRPKFHIKRKKAQQRWTFSHINIVSILTFPYELTRRQLEEAAKDMHEAMKALTDCGAQGILDTTSKAKAEALFKVYP